MAATTKSGNGKSTTTTMVTLISSDKERFEVAEATACMSKTISNMIEDVGIDGDGFHLPNVTGSVLAKVIEYCNKHAPAAAAAAAAAAASGSSSSSNATAAAGVPYQLQRELKSFDAAFIDVEKQALYDILLAANYLEVNGLLDLCCEKVADMVRGKTPEEIRQTFGIKNDFSPDEEDEIRREYNWAFNM
ncbi:hypothetical protein ACP4OV_013566 [Aristida adscensionis]